MFRKYENIFDNKNVKTILIISIIVSILIFFFQYIHIIDKEWLAYWSNFIPGISACIFAYLAIESANKSSQKAIEQQERILCIQHNKEIIDSFSNVLKQINLAFKPLKIDEVLLLHEVDNMFKSKSEILRIQSDLENVYIEWYSLINLYSELNVCFEDYGKIWNKARVMYHSFLRTSLARLHKYSVDQGFEYIDLIKTISKKKNISNIINTVFDHIIINKPTSENEDKQYWEDRKILSQYQKRLLDLSIKTIKKLDSYLKNRHFSSVL